MLKREEDATFRNFQCRPVYKKILSQKCFQVYNRICGIRDTFTERLKTLENEIIAKSAILIDRALQTPLNDDRHMHHELREIERNLFVLQV